VDGDTPLAAQQWLKVAWFQIPYMLPFLLVLAASWRRQPLLVRLLWLYLPILAAAYLSQHYIVHEVRSFWALAPVFTATVAVWMTPRAEPAPAPG
jgi:hypothetical protein